MTIASVYCRHDADRHDRCVALVASHRVRPPAPPAPAVSLDAIPPMIVTVIAGRGHVAGAGHARCSPRPTRSGARAASTFVWQRARARRSRRTRARPRPDRTCRPRSASSSARTAAAARDSRVPLGWIVFDDETVPQQEIYLSYANAQALMDSCARRRRRHRPDADRCSARRCWRGRWAGRWRTSWATTCWRRRSTRERGLMKASQDRGRAVHARLPAGSTSTRRSAAPSRRGCAANRWSPAVVTAHVGVAITCGDLRQARPVAPRPAPRSAPSASSSVLRSTIRRPFFFTRFSCSSDMRRWSRWP